MAPIKFEDNIKDKLEKRTIEPSDNAWNRLSEKLDAKEERSKNKIVWWLGIAASLVGVFLVTSLFFKTGEDQTVAPTLVETPVIDSTEIKETLLKVIENKEVITNKEVHINEAITAAKDVIKKPVIIKKKNSYKSNKEVLVNISKAESKDEVKKLNDSEIISTQQEINEALVQNVKLEKNDNKLFDSEIESLLESAQKDLFANTIKPENIKTVDANSLLQDVETALDQSFRDKVFNTLISGYNVVKTAVAERND